MMQRHGLNSRASIDPQYSHEVVDVILCVISVVASKDTSLWQSDSNVTLPDIA